MLATLPLVSKQVGGAVKTHGKTLRALGLTVIGKLLDGLWKSSASRPVTASAGPERNTPEKQLVIIFSQ